jgi:excisionase family DNA binding protein
MLSAGETKVTMSDKLLNTAEAARFLRVSSASVRRWSDSGLLRSRRVGPRRERRFTEADLERFLTPGSSAGARPGVPSKDVFVGGTLIPLHSHVSTFYDGDDGRLRLTVPFLRDGLILGEPCFLIAEGPVLDAYLEALSSQEGVDVAAAIRDQKLTTAPAPGSSVEGALHFWDQVLTRGLAAGPTLLRAVGEMSSARKGFESDAQMIEFEVAFTTIVKRLPTVALCQYDVREFDGETIFKAIRAHPDLYPLGIASFLV